MLGEETIGPMDLPKPSVRLEYSPVFANCVLEGQLLLVKSLVLCEKVNVRNVDPSNGWPSLFFAVKYNHVAIVKFLLDEGHEDERISLDFQRRTALMIATENDHDDCLEILAERFPETVNWQNSSGESPLTVAAKNGYKYLVELLLNFGADPNQQDNDGNSPLHHATSWGRVAVVQFLIASGSDYHLKNNSGWTCFDFCYSASLLEHLQEIVEVKESGKEVPPTSLLNRHTNGIGSHLPLDSLRAPLHDPSNLMGSNETFTLRGSMGGKSASMEEDTKYQQLLGASQHDLRPASVLTLTEVESEQRSMQSHMDSNYPPSTSSRYNLHIGDHSESKKNLSSRLLSTGSRLLHSGGKKLRLKRRSSLGDDHGSYTSPNGVYNSGAPFRPSTAHPMPTDADYHRNDGLSARGWASGSSGSPTSSGPSPEFRSRPQRPPGTPFAVTGTAR